MIIGQVIIIALLAIISNTNIRTLPNELAAHSSFPPFESKACRRKYFDMILGHYTLIS